MSTFTFERTRSIRGLLNAGSKKQPKRPSREEYLSQLDQKIQCKVFDRIQQRRHSAERRRISPNTSYFASNHILINNERTAIGLPTLMRDQKRDAEARSHASIMAGKRRLFHSGLTDYYKQTPSKEQPVGETIGSGKTINIAHQDMMGSVEARRCILNSEYKTMGTGSVKGDDGILYVCYIFRK
mmetsp:Transcript_20851/g.27456  ORF Transcript_20851/g.27456 Transcript_20851/m.27456 type:complete len:184 (+) Transcript_20851:159-710(+)